MRTKDYSKTAFNIGVIYCGKQAPGGNNICDGLLRYQEHRPNAKLLGFLGGVEGFLSGKYINITRETYAQFHNCGGYDYLGRSIDVMKLPDQLTRAVETCKKLNLSSIILIGATHTLTDASILSEYFLQQGIETRVITIPSTIDGNVHHKYIASSIGFDTASRVYSQYVGNMLTDSASAVKYWYFMRIMGKDPSHLVLEASLQTHPNVILISEESSARNETLPDIVNRICGIIQQRAEAKMNFGCVVVPEGLLNHIATYKHLIIELNQLFHDSKDGYYELARKMFSDNAFAKEKLTPWSFSIFNSLPDFIR